MVIPKVVPLIPLLKNSGEKKVLVKEKETTKKILPSPSSITKSSLMNFDCSNPTAFKSSKKLGIHPNLITMNKKNLPLFCGENSLQVGNTVINLPTGFIGGISFLELLPSDEVSQLDEGVSGDFFSLTAPVWRRKKRKCL